MTGRHIPKGAGARVAGLFRRFLPGLRKAEHEAADHHPHVPHRPGTTHPSRPHDPNAHPRGTRTDPRKNKQLQRENESADTMAQHGYDVEQNPPGRPNGRNPDYKIEGEYFDNLAPTTGNVDQVRKGISKKVLDGNGNIQADRILLNLDDSPLSLDDIKGVLTRKPISGLKEIIVIKGGKAIPFFPFD